MSVTSDLVTMRKGATAARVYAMGEVPGKTDPAFGYPYTVIGYAPNAPVVRNQLGQGDPVGRFTVQHFGQSAASVETTSAATFAAFDGKTYGGNVITQEVATPVDRDPDDRGVLSTTHTYRL